MIIKTKTKTIYQNYSIGDSNPFFIIAGPCVIESESMLDEVAKEIKLVSEETGILIYFKASYDKANRSNVDSFRGPGIKEGLKSLARIKKDFDLPIVTDVHQVKEVEDVSQVADMLQIPAFLCRQTDLIIEASKTNKWVNIKKGQFIAPEDTIHIVEKFNSTGNDKVTICERGYTFGYNNMVVDMRSLEIMRKAGIHTVMDITHATQLPGGGKISGGQREMAYPIGRAAVATGVDGLFLEIHPNPPKAKSDATNQLYLKDFRNFIHNLLKIDSVVKER